MRLSSWSNHASPILQASAWPPPAASMMEPAMDCYEDMFKEITRKLYGEDGVVAAGTAPGNPAAVAAAAAATPAEGLSAFGLAALGLHAAAAAAAAAAPPPPPPATTDAAAAAAAAAAAQLDTDKWVGSDEALQWTSSRIATYNPVRRVFRCAECECVGALGRVAEHWLGTHGNLRVYQCPHCPYASAWPRCVRMHLARQHNVTTEASESNEDAALYKESPVLEEVTRFLERLKNKVDATAKPSNAPRNAPAPSAGAGAGGAGAAGPKRYCCNYCPYATDRRDLFTRHENIHREEKPFQCYVCQKQFNRADHVKKHFLRMHRDFPYDLNRIRRPPGKPGPPAPPPPPTSQQQYYKYPPQPMVPAHPNLSIPAGFKPPNQKSPVNGCNAKSHGSKGKRKDKRYQCCYCTWSGVDNWCLKRHLNTHLKPFVCPLCEYRAARSERLATHLLKVHNKRGCGRCPFLADDQHQLAQHQAEHRHQPPGGGGGVRNHGGTRAPSVDGNQPPASAPAPSGGHGPPPGGFAPQGPPGPPPPSATNAPTGHPSFGGAPWGPLSLLAKPRPCGAERLFHYLEASDGSDAEHESDETFICSQCGCQLADRLSLETHQALHAATAPVTSPAVVAAPVAQRPRIGRYTCRLCGVTLSNQLQAISHLSAHEAPPSGTLSSSGPPKARSRKQRRPRKFAPGENDVDDQHRRPLHTRRAHLVDKYLHQLVTRERIVCAWCRQEKHAFPYHSRASLTLHTLWRHSGLRFRCEHCPARFRHRYQIILHANREHVPTKTSTTTTTTTTNTQANNIIHSGGGSSYYSNEIHVPEIAKHGGYHLVPPNTS